MTSSTKRPGLFFYNIQVLQTLRFQGAFHSQQGDPAPHPDLGRALPAAEKGCLHHSHVGVLSIFWDHKGPWHKVQIQEV